MSSDNNALIEDERSALRYAKSMVRATHQALREVSRNHELLWDSFRHWQSIERTHELRLLEQRIQHIERAASAKRDVLENLTQEQLLACIQALEERLTPANEEESIDG